ncbi:MAG TPA: 50S ribosomal protein L24 [Candidatus Paceibacterota bacterium]|jgi:large subunit ribosomal protein L24|nr:50S ribosomal protein L24 [Candidatus Paceibacterota bacterium]HPT40040.1 50S ribosomal protein L24 [Candidatus Paceibacterota bacterium]
MTQQKVKIKKGDEVMMLAGKDKGKKGKILTVIRKNNRVVVDGLNLVKKNRRPKKQGEKGEIISMPRAVDISNVALFCSRCNKGVRVGYRLSGDKKIRICRKCQETI